MREIELSKVNVRNLRQHGWLQYYTTEELQDNEIVFVKSIGECEVRVITPGLVELWMVKREGEER